MTTAKNTRATSAPKGPASTRQKPTYTVTDAYNKAKKAHDIATKAINTAERAEEKADKNRKRFKGVGKAIGRTVANQRKLAEAVALNSEDIAEIKGNEKAANKIIVRGVITSVIVGLLFGWLLWALTGFSGYIIGGTQFSTAVFCWLMAAAAVFCCCGITVLIASCHKKRKERTEEIEEAEDENEGGDDDVADEQTARER